MDYNQVASELEAIAETCGINALDYVPDDLPNKAFYVGEMDIEPNQSFNKVKPDGSRAGTDKAQITCRVLIARSTDKHAVKKMRTYLAGGGDASLLQALQAKSHDPEMPWTGLVVTAMRGNRMFSVGESKFYGTEIEINVVGVA
jgi:hypothetical protein